MKQSKLSKTALLSIIFAIVVNTTFAQSAKNKIIEDEYLLKARENIEKYRKGNCEITIIDSTGTPIKNIVVDIQQITQDFLFGNLSEEIFKPQLSVDDAKKFEARFKALFNFTELTVKWSPYEREQGKPEWQKLKQKLDWCKENGIVVKGHTLGWTHRAGTPVWLSKLTPEMATELYKNRIYNLVGGFKSDVNMWDVVNEPVNTIPWAEALKDTVSGESLIDEGTRYNVKNITLNQIIPWVENSLSWAHQANPTGDFILNEYSIISKPETREKFYNLIKELQKRNAPVTGIGIQAHEPRQMWFSPVDVIKTFDKFKELGLPIHITEFTPQSSGKDITGGWRSGSWTENAQAEFSEQFYTLAFSHPSVVSIHWWGLSDRMIWLKGGGLLDKDFNPKPVYNRLLKLIKEDWMTKNIKLNTDNAGTVNFRGFYGNYSIKVTTKDGKVREFVKHVGEKTENNFKISL